MRHWLGSWSGAGTWRLAPSPPPPKQALSHHCGHRPIPNTPAPHLHSDPWVHSQCHTPHPLLVLDDFVPGDRLHEVIVVSEEGLGALRGQVGTGAELRQHK
jgi:hypothetical protein